MQRVQIPYFPTYREVRHLLRVWPGRPKKQVTGLHASLMKLTGTPQSPVDWTDPDTWVPERLSGDDRDLASTIWETSNKTVNPRHIYGHWLLSQKYALINEESDGNLCLTERGKEFVDHENGATEIFLDEQEGVTKLLSLVADNNPTPARDILKEWGEYLKQYSSFRTSSTIHDALRRRLKNLNDRDFVCRNGSMYTITTSGLEYLAMIESEESHGSGKHKELRTLAKHLEASARKNLREQILDMEPIHFEYLIKHLLEEMNYQNVEVTNPSNDGGVDVIADIELGITSVREVVQVKRHKRTIQRKDLDALRGSLYRFNAVRGTIISTSNFSKGTKKAAFANGVAPITLIDGDKLIDLLIEHAIGVRKQAIEVLTIEPDAFSYPEE